MKHHLGQKWLFSGFLHRGATRTEPEPAYIDPFLQKGRGFFSTTTNLKKTLTLCQLTPGLPKSRTFDSHFLKDAHKLFP
jgi:hypothetical protein